MSNHFFVETEKLKQSILTLCTLVEESVRFSIQSVIDLDHDLASKVIESDHEIDNIEVEIEEECLKILALHQPVAKDLRFIIAVLKINNDLERIADLAVNIAERTIALSEQPPQELTLVFKEMSDRAIHMLKKSIDSLIYWNSSIAIYVCEADNRVDELYRDSFALVKKCILVDPSRIDFLLLYASIFRVLERIADQTTNIAEDVIYMSEGGIVRHTNLEEKELQLKSKNY
ncbi:Phosphate transport system regulatory protein PhoU [Chitinispirillum alkaliphilum]|nr:Phosphate transport system regulatory protein PhoU [Chitinispirillum alkaliphilum]